MIRRDGHIPNYQFVETRDSVRGIRALILTHFPRCHLLISCFNSDDLEPGPDELTLGWRTVGAGMLSPPMEPSLLVPAEQFDEWWVFNSVDDAARFPPYECFVNFDWWSLRSPESIVNQGDSNAAMTTMESLRRHQGQFWKLVSEFGPVAYVADGSRSVIASSNIQFLDDVVTEAP